MCDGEDWRVEGQGPWDGWRLVREPPDEGGGLRLEAADGWLGRTQGFAGAADVLALRWLLLADGRLFRLVAKRPESARYEIQNWDTPGAWLRARRERDRWTLAPTAAGRGFADLVKLELLLAAEIHRSESEP